VPAAGAPFPPASSTTGRSDFVSLSTSSLISSFAATGDRTRTGDGASAPRLYCSPRPVRRGGRAKWRRTKRSNNDNAMLERKLCRCDHYCRLSAGSRPREPPSLTKLEWLQYVLTLPVLHSRRHSASSLLRAASLRPARSEDQRPPRAMYRELRHVAPHPKTISHGRSVVTSSIARPGRASAPVMGQGNRCPSGP